MNVSSLKVQHGYIDWFVPKKKKDVQIGCIRVQEMDHQIRRNVVVANVQPMLTFEKIIVYFLINDHRTPRFST